MQLKRVTDGHIHYIFSECAQGPGGGAPIRWAIFAIFQQKNRDFNTIFVTFRTF